MILEVYHLPLSTLLSTEIVAMNTPAHIYANKATDRTNHVSDQKSEATA